MKTVKFLKSKNIRQILGLLILSGIVLPFQNCSEQQEFSASQSSVNTLLVYGDNEEDQELLRQKLEGAKAPTISQIFNQWSRISGTKLYQKVSDIIPDPSTADCFTSLDINGDWVKAALREDSTKLYQPGTESKCIGDEPFAAASWSYLNNTNTLKAAVNADRHTGFISGVPVDRYENEAIVSSSEHDDDGIGLVVAVLRDDIGTTHMLVAQRTHGGLHPNLGWGFVYAKYFLENGVIKNERKAIVNTAFGAISKNLESVPRSTPGADGWSGKRTFIKVERNKDIVKAYTSQWSSDPNQILGAEQDSEISIDLSNPALGLEIFRGAKKYGYSSVSQYASTFSNVKFKSTLDADKLYDLKNNLVYRLMKDNSGRYELVRGLTPKKDLGINVYLVNPETQKTFFIWYNGKYEEIIGEIPTTR